MGTVCEKITLKNVLDAGNAVRGILAKDKVREITVEAIVDTGAGTLVISDEIQKTLGLMTEEVDTSTLANGQKVYTKRAEAVKVCWQDRSMVCSPVVLPGAPNVLLGAIPLEDMDLIVDPKNQRLIGKHGDEPLWHIY
ncbi:MAG: hypothetical protein Ta2G_04390 [Termitinemataceae bacterium]|nr:MAG: hypothetical protein Ta2G_04390 [Termitinemataceae bacterium]